MCIYPTTWTMWSGSSARISNSVSNRSHRRWLCELGLVRDLYDPLSLDLDTFSRSRLIHVKGSLGFGLRLIVPETTACLMANLVSHLLSGNSLSSQSYLNNNSYGDYTSRHDTIESSITDESRSIIDANLSPVLDSFINNIKSTIVSKAEAKMNVVKVP